MLTLWELKLSNSALSNDFPHSVRGLTELRYGRYRHAEA